MNLRQAIEGFIVDGQVALKSEDTLCDYQRELKAFLNYVGNVPLEQVNADHVRHFLLEHRQRKIAEYTVWGYYKRLKAFLRRCWKEGLTPQNVMGQIPTPRVPQVLPNVRTAEQVEKLFRLLKRDPSQTGKRNLVIFATFMDCGIRSNELANLALEDVSLSELHLMIREGKWKKQRPVPISPPLKKYLWRYISEWRNNLRPRCENLFVNHEGRKSIASGVQVMVRRQLANIGVKGSTHMLRHSFATMYLRNGGDLERLRLILGL